ncbi:hypothetical protein K4K59_006797 [Colletotrichum sp. SAR11_240]|nr:hypothetical protein K4K59_006797 [Colletotrichum sp. SAR11_240]
MRDPRMTWRNWDPQQGSRIKINETLIHAARDAARIAMDPSVTNSTRRIALTNWNNFMFMMTISMAHEYVHVIVGALTAGSSPKTPLRVHFDLDEIIAVDEDTLTPAEQDWMANPSLASIPAGLEVRVIGESGFSWESMVLGGKIVSCFLASMQIPNSARSSSSGAPHVV